MQQDSILQEMILPESCIGILGGGQLGQMLAIAARQMGYQVAVLDPAIDCPAALYANHHLQADYANKAALRKLAELCTVITTEFENVPVASVMQLKEWGAQVYPDEVAVGIAQNRILEKRFFREHGLATAQFQVINNVNDCYAIDYRLLPGILKTARMGYDGKGQIKVTNSAKLVQAYQQLDGECILEQLVGLQGECSVLVARNSTGSKCYPVIENHHHNGILDVSYIPGAIDPELERQARHAAILLADKLNYIGLLAVEFFISRDGELLVNEIAPRPHNSGHITIEAAVTSQFEQQLRAICGLQLGDVSLKQPGAMLNLLGDVWQNRAASPYAVLCNDSTAKLHWYGKSAAIAGRKMGHIAVTGIRREDLILKIRQLKQALKIVD